MMRYRKWFVLPLILLTVCFGAAAAQAQTDGPPIDDAFVDALVMMAVNHDMMEGKNEAGDLWALRQAVNDYYEDRIVSLGTFGDTADLKAKQQLMTGKLDDKIKKVQGVDLIEFFVDLFTESANDQSDAHQTAAQRAQVVSGSDTPPADFFEVMESTIMTDIELQVNLLLDIDIINTQPSLAPAIAGSSGWSYTVPAITDSTSPISPASGDDSSGGADFWGDASSGSGDSGSSAPLDGTKLKPLRFTNNGFEAVTVVVESYQPAQGYSPNKPNVSTVVFPESNSSAYMDLPLGTYTFCYYWQLDQDYNNDGYFDYHHRTTSSVSLNVNSSDDPQSANAVTLSPDSVVSNPNGRCGESAQQNQGQNASGLTPEEQANQGTHIYFANYDTPDVDFFDGETDTLTISFTFSNGSVQAGVDGETLGALVSIGTNTYTANEYIYTFTMEGFVLTHPEYPNSKITYTLQD